MPLEGMIEQLGYERLISRGDSEPTILALMEAARRMCDVELAPEESPFGDRRANGLVEMQLRTRKASPESSKTHWKADTAEEYAKNTKQSLGW